MAERLAENAHDLWAKRKKEELDAIGELKNKKECSLLRQDYNI